MNQGDPVPRRLRKDSSWVVGVVFGLIFALAGTAGFVATFILPMARIVYARQWKETPCVIRASSVSSHRGAKGSTTHSVRVEYAYEFGGRPYVSKQYDFAQGSSGGYEGKRRAVAALPPGMKTVCYVNPRNPSEAVLVRGFQSTMWFGLMPLLFVAVGVFVAVLQARRGLRPAGEAADLSLPTEARARRMAEAVLRHAFLREAPPDPTQTGPQVLETGRKRVRALVFIFLFACVWNGIIAVAVASALRDWKQDWTQWLFGLFLLPFVGVGVVLIVAVFHSLLGLFNPRVKLVVSSMAVPLGGQIEVAWVLFGRAERLRRLQLKLVGREEARYRRGTSTATDVTPFADLDVADLGDLSEMAAGKARVTVPADQMHSFRAPNNRVFWVLTVKGEIPRWPDITDEFEIAVLPRPTAGGEA
jgi:hypothetical protein